MKEKIKRLFNVSDDDVIEQSKTEQGPLEEFMESFTQFDSTITVDTLNDLRNKTTIAENTLSDNVIRDRQTQFTDDVENKMKECKEHYADVSYFIKKAFPVREKIRNEFGENDYEDSKSKHAAMIRFMKELSAIMNEYQSELIAVGMSQEMIDRTGTLANELDEANIAQDRYMKKRPVLTEERIIRMNAVWEILVLISKAAKLIFKNEPSKMRLFLLPTRSVSHKEEIQTVEPQETIVTINEGIEEKTVLKIENKGTETLKFFVAYKTHNEIPANALELISGDTKVLEAGEISDGTYGKLLVNNPSLVQGKFKVTILE